MSRGSSSASSPAWPARPGPSGGLLLTLLGLGSADIGGAQLASTKAFTTPADVSGFVGAGTVAVDVAAADTLTVSTLLSLFNGAGFTGSGQVAGTVSLRYSYTPYAAGGQLSIDKVASVATAASGDVITYTLVFTNNGNVPVNALAINDATPAYTTYRSSRSVAIPAGMAASGATAPSVGAAGGLSWTFAGPLAAAASGSVEYSVRVD